VTGAVQPLEEFIAIARNRKIPILLDAAQTAGRIPISIGDAPVFVACSGHKGLYGMPGTGILTVPEGYDLPRWNEGGTGTASESLNHPKEIPMKWEAGTPNFLGIASLHFGVEFIQQVGMQTIHEREMGFVIRLREFLSSNRGFDLYSSVNPESSVSCLSFNLTGVSPTEVAMILDQRYEIAARAGLHCAAVLHQQLGTLPDGCIRVSPGYFNTEQDLLRLMEALAEIAKGYSN
jgi:selenocysteine lyase/cysteine desulfurase